MVEGTDGFGLQGWACGCPWQPSSVAGARPSISDACRGSREGKAREAGPGSPPRARGLAPPRRRRGSLVLRSTARGFRAPRVDVGLGGKMAAVAAGGPLGKGRDISLAALQRHDPYINRIVDVASQVALYTFGHRANEWVRAGATAACRWLAGLAGAGRRVRGSGPRRGRADAAAPEVEGGSEWGWGRG